MSASYLDRLASAIGSPGRPPFPIDWAAVHRHLGVELPTDYQAFSEAYGPVLVGQWLRVFVPHESDYGGYLGELDTYHGLHRSLRAENPPEHPYAFHPEPGGLLAWGRTRRTDMFFWDTSASTDPDQWPTLVYAKAQRHGLRTRNSWRRLDTPMAEVLLALVAGDLRLDPAVPCDPLPGVQSPNPLGFTPFVGAQEQDQDTPTDRLPAAGVALASTIQIIPAPTGSPEPNRVWQFPPDLKIPPDHQALLANLGAGTLAGVLRLLGPDAPAGFDLATEQAGQERRLTRRRAEGHATIPAPIAPAPAGCASGGSSPAGRPAGGCRPPRTRQSGRWSSPTRTASAGSGWTTRRRTFSPSGWMGNWTCRC